MNLNLQFAIGLGGLAVILLVFRFLKRHSLHPSFAVLWSAIGLFLITVSIFEQGYAYVAKALFGLYGGDHLIYVICICFLLVYNFFLTTRISLMSDRISKLISFTAVLENELVSLRDKGSENGKS